MFQIENSTARFRTASQSWFQNSFWNHDWTIFLLRKWQNVRYKQTSKQRNKQKLKISISTTLLPTTSQSWFQNSFWNHDWTIFLVQNWQNVRYIKWEKVLCKMGKSEKTTFHWLKVSRLLNHVTTSQTWFQDRSQIFFRAPEVPVLRGIPPKSDDVIYEQPPTLSSDKPRWKLWNVSSRSRSSSRRSRGRRRSWTVRCGKILKGQIFEQKGE